MYMINICVSLPSITDNYNVKFSDLLGIYLLSVSPLLIYPSWLHYYSRILFSLILFSYTPNKQSKTENFHLKGILNILQIIIKSCTAFFFPCFQCKEAP